MIPNLFLTAYNLHGGDVSKPPKAYIQLQEFWGSDPITDSNGLYKINPNIKFNSYESSLFDPVQGEPDTQKTRNSLTYYFMTMCLPTGYWGSAVDQSTGALTTTRQAPQSQSGYSAAWRNYFSSNGTQTDCPNGGAACATQSFPAPQGLYMNCGQNNDRNCSTKPVTP
jgi:hypothetical protein